MTSINEQVNLLHASFCAVTDRQLPLLPAYERWWYNSAQCGVTPEMVTAVMQARMRREYSTAGMRFHCLSLKHCIGDEERLAQFVDEAAQIAATKRKKVFAPAKQEVLRATGRPDEPDAPGTRSVSEVFDAMRKETA